MYARTPNSIWIFCYSFSLEIMRLIVNPGPFPSVVIVLKVTVVLAFVTCHVSHIVCLVIVAYVGTLIFPAKY